ncbi:MAG: hypothetical protein C0501_02570 [Isosphaera sp.]|nr:hypothetical protein [Isosphaera sp.]
METVAIVGGGFSGTAAAVNLARLGRRPLRVAVVNRGHPPGRGVAYGTRRPEHLLNVAARNMSALPDHPNHFVDWLRTRAEYADVPDPALRETFLPRRVYGDYLRALAMGYFAPVDPRPVRVDVVEDEAVDVAPVGAGGRVHLAGGNTVTADRVLLATGNRPPGPLPSAAEPFAHRAYHPDPWGDWADRLPDPGEDVVLLGTGLTAVDVFLTLAAAGWRGTVHAVSRNGLLPLSHFRGVEYPDFPPPDPERHCGLLRARGANPAIAVDRLRPHTQRIWQAFSAEEKREFCSRYAGRWNVTRHRVPEAVHARVAEAVAAGTFRVVTGRVCGLADAGGRVRVTVEADGGARTAVEGGLVVNCTGPEARFSASDSPLFRNLLARGLARADALDMGLEVDGDFAVVGRDGRRSGFLYAIGPLLRGTLWETTAVPELRGQAMRVAQTILGDREARLASASADVIEYCI